MEINQNTRQPCARIAHNIMKLFSAQKPFIMGLYCGKIQNTCKSCASMGDGGYSFLDV